MRAPETARRAVAAETRALLSGNEAIARGAWEAGVRVAAGYPGTPSTEILESLSSYEDVDARLSTNEKVALDVALGASLGGARARGGAARSDVVIADGEIGFPTAQALDVLVALTQLASDRYSSDLKPAGLLVVDEQEVPDQPVGSWTAHPLPIIATSVRVAGSPVAANVVALGVLVGVTGVVDPRALERAVAARVPPRSREMNLRALAAGVRLAGAGTA